MISDPQAELCRSLAMRYIQMGLWPLPSRSDEKRPYVKFREYWESPPPSDLFFRDYGAPVHNIQLVCGPGPGLAVIDLDGREAVGVWSEWCSNQEPFQTWEVAHDESKGKHVYFAHPPDDLGRKRVLWIGDGEHSRVELFLGRGLIVAPPSFHVKTGRPYRFLDGRKPSREMRRPAPLPGWLIAMPDVTPKPEPRVVEPALMPLRRREWSGERVDRDLVLDSIPDKVAVAKGWGLQTVGDESAEWVSCYRVTRPERVPSGRISQNGCYWEPDFNGGKPISLFDLGAMIGGYADWRDCCQGLAEYWGVVDAA